VSLVEVMASALILGVTFFGVVSALRTSRELEFRKNLERQARHLAYSILEGPTHHYYPYTTYEGMPDGYTESTLLNPSTARPINATILVNVLPAGGGESFANWTAGNIRYRTVRARVSWTVDGVTDTVLARKVIAEVQ
jgi:Tfp pilus assembly protein PilV